RRLREPSPRRPPCRRHTWILATCESRRDLGIVALHPGHPIDRRVAVIRPYNVRLLALAVAAPAVQLRQLLREHTRLPRLHRGMRPIGTPPRLSGISPCRRHRHSRIELPEEAVLRRPVVLDGRDDDIRRQAVIIEVTEPTVQAVATHPSSFPIA